MKTRKLQKFLAITRVIPADDIYKILLSHSLKSTKICHNHHDHYQQIHVTFSLIMSEVTLKTSKNPKRHSFLFLQRFLAIKCI